MESEKIKPDFDIDILVRFFILKKAYASVNTVEEIPGSFYTEFCKKLKSVKLEFEKELNCEEIEIPECDEIKEFKTSIDSDLAKLTLMISYTQLENSEEIIDKIYSIAKKLKYLVDTILDSYHLSGIKVANDFFLSNPLVLIAIGYREESKELKEKVKESVFRSFELRKLLVFDTEETNETGKHRSETTIYGQILRTTKDSSNRGVLFKYIKVYYAEYSLDTEVAASYLLSTGLSKLHTSLNKIDFTLNQIEKLENEKYNSGNIANHNKTFNLYNIIDSSIEEFKRDIQSLENDEYEIFNFTEAKQKEIDDLYIKALEYHTKLKDYYATITRHYDSLKLELNFSDKISINGKDIEANISAKDEKGWIEFIDADLHLETRVKNISTEISYTKANFDLLSNYYNNLKQIIQYRWSAPPKLIIEDEDEPKNQNTYLVIATCKGKRLSLISRKTNSPDEKERVINTLLNTFKDNKIYAEQIISKFSEVFTNFLNSDKYRNTIRFFDESAPEVIYKIFKNGSSKGVKIKDKKEFLDNIPLLLKSLKRLYFCEFEECIEIKNMTEASMPDILFLSAINEYSINLVGTAFDEYQRNKQFDKIEKLLLLLPKDSKVSNENNGIEQIKNILAKKAKIFAFNYYINRYKIYEALSVASSEESISFFFRIIGFLWKDSKNLTKSIIAFLILAFSVLSPIYAFKNFPKQLKITSIWINMFILFLLLAIGTAVIAEPIYIRLKAIVRSLYLYLKARRIEKSENIYSTPESIHTISRKHIANKTLLTKLVSAKYSIAAFLKTVKSGTTKIFKKVYKNYTHSLLDNSVVNLHISRLLLPRLIGAIIVGIFGSIMADIDWTLIANFINYPVYYYLWVLLSIVGSLYYFYYKISPWYNIRLKAWSKALDTSLVGFLYSYALSTIIVNLVVPIRFVSNGNSEVSMVQMYGVAKISNATFSKLIEFVSSFYYPYYVLFFASISLLLGTALQLLWSKEQITEEF